MQELSEMKCKYCGKSGFDSITALGQHSSACKKIEDDRKKLGKREESRKERIPLGIPRKQLSVPDELKKKYKNYSLRWLHDDGTRIDDAKNAGYTFVEKEEGISAGDTSVTSGTCGDIGSAYSKIGSRKMGTKLYLMKLPNEFKREYDNEKKAQQQDLMKALKRGKTSIDEFNKSAGEDEDHSYVPSIGISIQQK